MRKWIGGVVAWCVSWLLVAEAIEDPLKVISIESNKKTVTLELRTAPLLEAVAALNAEQNKRIVEVRSSVQFGANVEKKYFLELLAIGQKHAAESLKGYVIPYLTLRGVSYEEAVKWMGGLCDVTTDVEKEGYVLQLRVFVLDIADIELPKSFELSTNSIYKIHGRHFFIGDYPQVWRLLGKKNGLLEEQFPYFRNERVREEKRKKEGPWLQPD